jgi:lysophospholipase L1-like esterase
MPGKKDLVRANSLGLRGPDIGTKRPGQPRILVLGDSVAFGYDVAEKDALPSVLARSHLDQGILVETISAAVPGWCQRQHRLFLEKHGSSLDPDVVVVVLVLNDIPELQQGQAELEAALRSANAFTWLAEHSALAAMLRSLLGKTVAPFDRPLEGVSDLAYHPDSEAARSAMALEQNELLALARVAREQGRHLVLALVPFRFQLGDPKSDAPQRQIRAFAEEHGIPVLDLLPRLRRHAPEDVFTDNVHLSKTGNLLVAREISDWLLRRRLVGPRSRPRPAPGAETQALDGVPAA